MNSPSVLSRNGVTIRLPDERWQHIIEEHGELEGLRADVSLTVEQADRVLAGSVGELFAVRMIEPAKAMVVVYREISADDGFIITAFVTRRLRTLEQREQLWPPQV
jgi:hypothetical protein